MPTMPVLRRPGLLVSTAVTITVPGLLAVFAVLGHEHAAPGAGIGAMALGATSPGTALAPASKRAMLAAGPAPVRDAAAQMVKVSGMNVRTAVLSAAMTAQQAFGMKLLGKAAAAGLSTSYQGVELIAESGVAGTVTMVSNVWHRGGGQTITQTSDATGLAGTRPYVAYDQNTRAPEGVFGVTNTLVGLIDSHYIAVFRGTGTVISRPTLVVDLQRADGSLAARFWLDSKTKLPLQRDVFDTSAQLISQDAFVQVQFGRLTAPPEAAAPEAAAPEAAAPEAAAPEAAAPEAAAPARPSWSQVQAPARLLADLDGQGWQLSAVLPGGLSLYQAAQSRTDSGEVVDLGYSDGLSVISLFVQRGTLAKMAGWQPVSLSGHVVYVAGHSITWTGRGFVYTMIADAPPRTVREVISALPQNAAPGFLARIGRGLDRMAGLVNPFR